MDLNAEASIRKSLNELESGMLPKAWLSLFNNVRHLGRLAGESLETSTDALFGVYSVHLSCTLL